MLFKDNPVLQDLGTTYIETSDCNLFEQIKKIKCPIRLSDFLDRAVKENPYTKEIYKTPDYYDFFIDLSDESERINKENFDTCIDIEGYLGNPQVFTNKKHISYYCRIGGHPLIDRTLSTTRLPEPMTRTEAIELLNNAVLLDLDGEIVIDILSPIEI
jgi:hypothetical protein